ncbi:MAG: twin-arginine translocase TatA/TatE family subunit [Candidatus Altiarchaeota archaeon]
MIGNIEFLFVLFLFLVLFGGKRLPEFAKALGEAVAEFRKASQDLTRPKKSGRLAG